MFDAALDAANPTHAVSRAIHEEHSVLDVDGGRVPLDGRLVVIAIGKAAEAMAVGAVDALGERIDAGYVVTKYGHASGALDARFSVFEAGHPIPDQAGVKAARTVLDAVTALDEQDVVLALISGGGSALFEAPVEPVTLDDFAKLTQLMLRAGAPIQDLNRVRIPLSSVKGGKLRQASKAGRFVTLLLSDVLGNDPRVIASGPTVPGDLSRRDAIDILERYQLRDVVPVSVLHVLESEPATNEAGIGYDDDVVLLVADNASALNAAASEAETQGLPVDITWREREGEAAVLGREWIDALAGREGPLVLLGGGEATVTVRGDGHGGRNTEFALAAGLGLERRKLDSWTVASLATDGQDAMTEAAGAMACADSIRQAREAGLDPERCLEQNDSRRVFETSGELVVTGPTGTNVNDLYFAVKLSRQEVAIHGDVT
jgi:glycerate-2-kinase